MSRMTTPPSETEGGSEDWDAVQEAFYAGYVLSAHHRSRTGEDDAGWKGAWSEFRARLRTPSKRSEQ